MKERGELLTKRGKSKENVGVLFLWRPLNSLVKGETGSCGDLSWEHEDLSDCEPVVTDVLVSPSSEVTEFC